MAQLSRDVRNVIGEKFYQVQGYPNVKGFGYSAEAICILMDNPRIAMTQELYPMVAKVFDTTPTRVERAIRHFIQIIFERNSDKKMLFDIFPTNGRKPTNGEFLHTMADVIKRGL